MSNEDGQLPLRMVKADQTAAYRPLRSTGEVETSSCFGRAAVVG